MIFGARRASEGKKESHIENSERRPHIKAAARDATVVSIVRGACMSCNFPGRQQLVEGGAREPHAVRATRSRFIFKGVVPQSTMLDLNFHEQGPPLPPGEPTALNKERVGQCDEVLRHGARIVRGRHSW